MGPQSWRWVFLDFPEHLILHSTCFSETKWQRHFSVWFPWHILEYSLDPAVCYIPQPRENKDYKVAQGKGNQRQTLQIEPWTKYRGLFQHHGQLHNTASNMPCTVFQKTMENKPLGLFPRVRVSLHCVPRCPVGLILFLPFGCSLVHSVNKQANKTDSSLKGPHFFQRTSSQNEWSHLATVESFQNNLGTCSGNSVCHTGEDEASIHYIFSPLLRTQVCTVYYDQQFLTRKQRGEGVFYTDLNKIKCIK